MMGGKTPGEKKKNRKRKKNKFHSSGEFSLRLVRTRWLLPCWCVVGTWNPTNMFYFIILF